MSNGDMRQTILSLLFLLLTFCVRAQGPSADKTEMGAIQRTKTLPISLLDRDLPKVTLEFFLMYEGEGAPIKWAVNDCVEQTRGTVVDHGRDSAMGVRLTSVSRTVVLQPYWSPWERSRKAWWMFQPSTV